MVEHGVAGAHHPPRDLRRRGVEGEVSELGDGPPVAVVIEVVALRSHGYCVTVTCKRRRWTVEDSRGGEYIITSSLLHSPDLLSVRVFQRIDLDSLNFSSHE